MDATIAFLEQHGNHISLLVLFTKHRQLARQVGDNHTLLIVEKEAMAPHTVSGLARRMAHGGHIHHKNREFIGVGWLVPTSAFSHGPDLCSRDLDLKVYGQ